MGWKSAASVVLVSVFFACVAIRRVKEVGKEVAIEYAKFLLVFINLLSLAADFLPPIS
jgi:hypothetical protein